MEPGKLIVVEGSPSNSGGCSNSTELALDVSLEKARALHHVWRALNDGDCPKCHKHYAATMMDRFQTLGNPSMSVRCPDCGFTVYGEEIDAIECLFAPAMDAAVAIFEEWRTSR